MKIRWKRVFYFVFLLGSMFGFKNAVGQNDSIQNKNIESNLSENSFQISGVVRDSSDNSPITFCNIIIYDKNNRQINGTITDFDGIFHLNHIPKGNYKITATFVGYKTVSIDSISEKRNKKIEILLSPNINNTDSIIIMCYYRVPIIDKDIKNSEKTNVQEDFLIDPKNTTTGETIDSKQIKNMPIRR